MRPTPPSGDNKETADSMAPPWRALLPTKRNFRAWRQFVWGERGGVDGVRPQRPQPVVVTSNGATGATVGISTRGTNGKAAEPTGTGIRRHNRTSALSLERPTRITKKTKRQARRPWERSEYVARLEQLIDGADLVEATEETRNALSAQIPVMLASPEDEICNDQERLDYLVTEQRQADAEARQQWWALHDHAGEVLDTVTLDAEFDRPSILPGHFRDQLENYEHARSALLKRKRKDPNLDGELDAINAKLSIAEGKHNFLGWTPTTRYAERLRISRDQLSRSKAVRDACCVRSNDELRHLCRRHAPRTLQELLNVDTEADQTAGLAPVEEEVDEEEFEWDPATDPHQWKFQSDRLYTGKLEYEARWEPFASNKAYNKKFDEKKANGEEWTQADEDNFTMKWFQENLAMLRELEEDEEAFPWMRRDAMLAGERPRDLGSSVERNWRHKDDGRTESMGTEAMRWEVEGNGFARPHIEAWLEAHVSPAGQAGTSPPSGSFWDDQVSVAVGDTRSACDTRLPSTARKRKLTAWSTACAKLREQAVREREKFGHDPKYRFLGGLLCIA